MIRYCSPGRYYGTVPTTLPRLRMDLDFMPSPIEDRPGLLIRDSFHYSDTTLVIPTPIVPCLACFDGERTDLDLREFLVRQTGQLDIGQLQSHLIDSLRMAGFLEDETFDALRQAKHQKFADSPVRLPAHAGSAYPDEPGDLKSVMAQFLERNGAPPKPSDGLIAIAAPHASPEAAWESYRDAYHLLGPEHAERTFVILGTSHYGAADRFGMTKKPFLTPYGEAQTDRGLVEWLQERAPEAILMEDYVHAVEHSIEFQVVFLQALYGKNVRILPILCGPFARSIYEGGRPEANDEVRAFLDALGEMSAKEGDRLMWVLGVDMAHRGARYGDSFEALPMQGRMLETRDRDAQRIDRLAQGDSEGFWELVQEQQDDLKWCGSSPFYTFLKAVPGARGALERYEQWDIDDQSVVSFAAMGFHKAG
jgi:AmmeMemoRadiSam system protein B